MNKEENLQAPREKAAGNPVHQTAIYGIGEVIPPLVGFLLLPLYTHFLTPADYGVLAILEMTSTYYGIVISAGFSSALLRFYNETDDGEWRRRVFISTIAMTLVLGAGGIVLGGAISTTVAQHLLGTPDYGLYVTLVLATVCLQSSNAVTKTLLRVREQASLYLYTNLIRLGLNVILNVLFIAVFKWGIMGFLLSNLITSLTFFLTVSMYMMIRNWARPSRAIMKNLISYSLPYIPLGFVEVFITNIGVLTLTLTGNLPAIGVFAIGQKLGTIVSFAYRPIGTMWIPRMYKIVDEADAAKRYARTTTLIVFILSVFLVALGISAREVVDIVTPAEYSEAWTAIIPIGIGYLFFSLRPSIRFGITIAKKTKILPFLSLIPAVIGFPVVYWMAKYQGIAGAAWGTCLVMVVILFVTGGVSQKYLRVPFEWRNLFLIALGSFVCVVTGALVMPYGILLKMPVVLLYVVLMYVAGIPNRGELIYLLDSLGLSRLNRIWRAEP